MSSPRIDDGWWLAMASSVPLWIASTNPSPSKLREERNVVTLVCAGDVSSWSDGGIARSWMRDPPGCSRNTAPSKKPARFSVIWLEPPRIGVKWHSPQPAALKIGPRPSATDSGPVNSSAAVSKLHSSSGIIGELWISLRLDLGPNPDYRDIAKWARTSPAMIAAFYDQTHPQLSVERIVGFRKQPSGKENQSALSESAGE